ncbi:MAG: Uma2 family endonuclease [Deltaproteobacteria bacterium]|nr:Uma2 family endonuclease [Deltaproteobacteria bacterium]
MELAPTAYTRPPRAPNLVLDPRPEDVGAKIDWSSWYLTDDDDMGQSPKHGIQSIDFHSSLKVLASERGWTDVFVGMDAYFAWVPHEPLVRISPDAYLLDRPPPDLPEVFETWQPGISPPRFALEVIGKRRERVEKDLSQNPPKYAQLGAQELIVFDPEAVMHRPRRRKPRIPLTIFRRDQDGIFSRIYAGDGNDPVRTEQLDAWVVVRVENGIPKLRICRDEGGSSVVPTQGELAEQEKSRAEQEKSRAEQESLRAERERSRAEQERSRAEDALEKVRALETELARLKGLE